jgi:sensor histidine kinase YesM
MIYLIGASGHGRWFEATLVVLILCLVYQFICLSAWYSCRYAPIESTTLSRIWLTHLAGAVVLSLLWMELARGITYLLSGQPRFAGLYERFAPELPLVFGAGILLYLLAVASNYVVLAVTASHEAEERALQTSVLARDAELKALKAQINPHFLFNSLNSISALTSIDPARAREMCLLLADFLRMTLKLGEKALIPLSEELRLLEKFLAIEKVRFGARLNMEMKIAETAGRCMIPTLLLQPLVENAVWHGIAKLAEGGLVRLTADEYGGRLAILVENSMDPDAPATRRGGVGLRNVQERLEARYGKNANLRATADEDMFRVNLTMPAEIEDRA